MEHTRRPAARRLVGASLPMALSPVHDTQDKLDELERHVKKLDADLGASKDDRQSSLLRERLREAARDQRQLRDQVTTLKLSS